MPARLPKACRKAGCRNTTTNAHGYCTHHANLASWGAFQARRRKNPYATAEWKRKRARINERDGGLCQECKRNGMIRAAKVCDHIVPRWQGGTEDDSNLEMLCQDCSNKKTSREGHQAKREQKQ